MQVCPLGKVWAANTVNTVIFRHHAMLTIGRFQFSACYVNAKTLRLIQRDLNSEQLFTFDLEGEYNLQDAHNCISLGCDNLGHLHLIYDLHGSRVRYRRSKHPLDIHGWTDELSMTGKHEDRVTYPTFLVQPNDAPLLLLYRDGNWKSGSARLKEYCEDSSAWADRELPILSGSENKPWTSNAYWNHPAVSEQGVIHLSFVWRTDYSDDEQRINNINIDYARSVDGGKNWQTSHGRTLRLPITQANSETIFPIGPGLNSINQTSMALDSTNHPHIVFYSNDNCDIPQYQHLWFTGREWKHTYISARVSPFVLKGGGTLQIPISRPEIVIDDDDYVYVIYRGDLTDNKLVAQRLTPPLYECATKNVVELWEEDVGQAEPIIDRLRWERDRILSLYIQRAEQPDNEAQAIPSFEEAYIVDRQLPYLFS